MQILCRESLPTVAAVREHLHRNRDDLAQCVLGFSGGKESSVLAALVREVRPDVPLLYAWCPGLEWIEHEEYVRRWGATLLDTGRDWDWFGANPWAFLHSDSRSAERWAKAHHRGALRRYARENNRTLLWGNRTADRNTVPAVRYRPSAGPELWMPLRDMSDAEVVSVLYSQPLGYSPAYLIPTVSATGHVASRVRAGLEPERWRQVRQRSGSAVFARFDALYRSQFGASPQ